MFRFCAVNNERFFCLLNFCYRKEFAGIAYLQRVGSVLAAKNHRKSFTDNCNLNASIRLRIQEKRRDDRSETKPPHVIASRFFYSQKNL